MPSLTRSPGTVTDDAGIGTVAWNDAGNATASDDSYATVNFGGTETSHYLIATGFDFSAIPPTATINGIVDSYERAADTGSSVSSQEVRVVREGVIEGDDKDDSASVFWATSDEIVDFGGVSDLWGLTWTVAQIQAANSGCAIVAANASGGVVARIDHIQRTVHYTEAASPPTLSSIDPTTGTAAGNTLVTLTGTDFVDGATVTFDGQAATSVTFVNSTSITCRTPAHAAGAVDVVVTNPDLQSDSLVGGYTYTASASGAVSLHNQHRFRY